VGAGGTGQAPIFGGRGCAARSSWRFRWSTRCSWARRYSTRARSARAVPLVPRCALSGPVRAVHACPLVEHGLQARVARWALLLLPLGRAAELRWSEYRTAASDREARPAASTAAPRQIEMSWQPSGIGRYRRLRCGDVTTATATLRTVGTVARVTEKGRGHRTDYANSSWDSGLGADLLELVTALLRDEVERADPLGLQDLPREPAARGAADLAAGARADREAITATPSRA
jgi:hypothetical protein